MEPIFLYDLATETLKVQYGNEVILIILDIEKHNVRQMSDSVLHIFNLGGEPMLRKFVEYVETHQPKRVLH